VLFRKQETSCCILPTPPTKKARLFLKILEADYPLDTCGDGGTLSCEVEDSSRKGIRRTFPDSSLDISEGHKLQGLQGQG